MVTNTVDINIFAVDIRNLWREIVNSNYNINLIIHILTSVFKTEFLNYCPQQVKVGIEFTLRKHAKSLKDFDNTGYKIWGQKTLQNRNSSILSLIDEKFLLLHIRSELERLGNDFLFELNDDVTRCALKSSVDNYMAGLHAKNIVFDYKTICDITNNTPDIIDANQLYFTTMLKQKPALQFARIDMLISPPWRS